MEVRPPRDNVDRQGEPLLRSRPAEACTTLTACIANLQEGHVKPDPKHTRANFDPEVAVHEPEADLEYMGYDEVPYLSGSHLAGIYSSAECGRGLLCYPHPSCSPFPLPPMHPLPPRVLAAGL